MTDQRKPIIEIDSREILKALSLRREPFVDFALLLGTDFTSRLKNVGPVRALKFIREHGSIEEIVKTQTKYPPQSDLPEYLAQVELGREIFSSLPPVPSPDKLQQLPADEAGIHAVVERFGLSTEMPAEEEDFFTVALKGNYFGDNPHQD
jgi:flap endonuclease-1